MANELITTSSNYETSDAASLLASSTAAVRTLYNSNAALLTPSLSPKSEERGEPDDFCGLDLSCQDQTRKRSWDDASRSSSRSMDENSLTISGFEVFDEEDNEDDIDQPMMEEDPERLKAFNLFVRSFADENLDRMIPISKQPREKVQAILDACDRQFPEFQHRSRKRLRTYLKACRRNGRRHGGILVESIRQTPAHLTSPAAEKILQMTLKNEMLNKDRIEQGLPPISCTNARLSLNSIFQTEPRSNLGTTVVTTPTKNGCHPAESSIAVEPKSKKRTNITEQITGSVVTKSQLLGASAAKSASSVVSNAPLITSPHVVSANAATSAPLGLLAQLANKALFSSEAYSDSVAAAAAASLAMWPHFNMSRLTPPFLPLHLTSPIPAHSYPHRTEGRCSSSTLNGVTMPETTSELDWASFETIFKRQMSATERKEQMRAMAQSFRAAGSFLMRTAQSLEQCMLKSGQMASNTPSATKNDDNIV